MQADKGASGKRWAGVRLFAARPLKSADATLSSGHEVWRRHSAEEWASSEDRGAVMLSRTSNATGFEVLLRDDVLHETEVRGTERGRLTGKASEICARTIWSEAWL